MKTMETKTKKSMFSRQCCSSSFITKTFRTCWPGPQFVGTVPTTTGGTDTGVFSNQCIGTFFATTKRFRHGTHGVGRTTDRSGLHPCQPPSVVVVVTVATHK